MRPVVFAAVLVGLVVLPAMLPADSPEIAPTEFRTPDAELKSFRLPPGFEAQLVASEPDIQKPINLAFDAKGRLWVSCTIEYPFPAAEGKGRDRIKVLEDFAPDGRARKITTFADGLNIPIGVLPYKDGAIAYSIPNLWRLRDTDNDGKCDQRKVFCSGFGHKDTHGMINGLVLGYDGWVYCCHGFANDSTVKGSDASELRMNSGNVFRVKPDGSHVELVSRGQVNPFGQCIDEFGNLYTSDCHSKPITQLIRGAVYSSFGKPHDGLGFGPDMVHKYRGSTALCGLCYYSANHFPEQYRGGIWLGDVVNNRINYFTVERKGGTYTAQQQADFVTTDDAWFRPVDIKLGPDGALYVADFYNRIIGHYEVPLTHPGRDRTSGRIWRIVYKGTDGKAAPPKAPRVNWTKATVNELIDDLGHPNLTIRMMATNQMVERGWDVVAPLRARLKPDWKALDADDVLPMTHALWVLERLGALRDRDIDQVLKVSHVALRVHALRVMAERPRLTDEQIKAVCGLLSGSFDGLVRRCAADVLGRHPGPEARRALLRELTGLGKSPDTFLRYASRLALREQFRGRLDDEWNQVLENNRSTVADVALGLPEAGAAHFLALHLSWFAENKDPKLPEYAHHVIRHGRPESTNMLFSFFTLQINDRSFEYGRNKTWILAILRGCQERGQGLPMTMNDWMPSQCSRLLGSPKPEDIQDGIELAAAARNAAMQTNVLRVLIDRQKPEAIRLAALNGLSAFDPKKSVNTLALRLADATESPALREKLAQSLAGINAAEARTALLAALPTAPAKLASAIAAGLAGSPDGTTALLDAVAAGKASPRLLQERPVQVRIAALDRAEFAERVKKLTADLPPADVKLAAMLRARAAGYAKAHPDAVTGAVVYEKYCAACHQIAGKGAKVGPQLDGIGVRGLDRLLEDVLDPNRNVDQTFRATTLTLKNGQTLIGLVLREEGEVIIVADAQGKEQRIGRDQIAERELSPLSPMPANWADQIAEKEFQDLMAYLLAQRAK